jgi:hypothetical protein
MKVGPLIRIGEKFAPFSHLPGTRVLVPGSDWVVQCFPALLRIEGRAEIPIALTGPVAEFTVQLDLEKNGVLIWGKAAQGYFKYRLTAEEPGLVLTLERGPKEGVRFGDKTLSSKEKVLIALGGQFYPCFRTEKLSLGNFKSQNWDIIGRNYDLRDMIPPLFLLGQKVPSLTPAVGGTAVLLPERLDLFVRAGLTGLLLPRLQDSDHHGIGLQAGSGNPLSLLNNLYRAVRAFLIVEQNPVLEVLPHLPHSWDAGRTMGLVVEGLGTIDLEWSRRMVRRMIVRTERDSAPLFRFAKPIASFRLNGQRRESGESLSLQAGKTYLFDRFQK